MPQRYSVIVGNIGQVWTGNNLMQAWAQYQDYKAASQEPQGRASGEPVTLFDKADIRAEYPGTVQAE